MSIEESRYASGPDDRDADLLDGSWEARYYAGQVRSRDWRAIGIGLSLLLLGAIVLPLVVVFSR